MKALAIALVPLAVLAFVVLYLMIRPPSAFEQARSAYDFLQKNRADSAQLCEAAARVRDAARDARQDQDYQFWDIRTRLDCNQVNLDRL